MCIYSAFKFSQRGLPLVLSLLVFIVLSMHVSDAQPTGEKDLAGEKFKNVTVLTNMPADQMGKVMNIMSASLGVNCNYCHEGTNFAKENVGQKESGRRMLSMTLSLNQSAFAGKAEVTCNTCHRGQSRPSDAIRLDTVLQNVRPSKLERKLTADEILSKFFDTLGGKDKLDAIKSRHVIAERIEPTGKREPEELWQTATGLSRMVTQYGMLSVVEGFDGQNAWKHAIKNSICGTEHYLDSTSYFRRNKYGDRQVHVSQALVACACRQPIRSGPAHPFGACPRRMRFGVLHSAHATPERIHYSFAAFSRMSRVTS